MDTCDRNNNSVFRDEDSCVPKTPLKPTTEEFSPYFFSRNSKREGVLNPLNAEKGTKDETCKIARWKFTHLMALQEGQTSTATKTRGSHTNEVSLPASDHHMSNYTNQFQYGFSVAHGYANGVDSTPTKAAAFIFSSKTASQIAPATPENGTRAVFGQLSRIQCVPAENSEKAAKDLSVSADCVVMEENHNPEREGDHVISMIQTPEQRPKRKKHRPKVITEGKPRPRKQVVQNNASNIESPTAKRKYVRKKPLDKDSATTPTESREIQSIRRKYVRRNPPKKISSPPDEAIGFQSTRRSLNFDTEEQPGGENSKYKPNSNDFQPQAQDVGSENCRKTPVTLGHGIEVILETTQRGTTCDLGHSLNQLIQDYVSTHGKTAPSTLLAADTCSTQTKWRNNFQESLAEEEDEETARSQQQSATHCKSEIENQLVPVNLNDPNESIYTTLTKSRQSSGSGTRDFNFIQHASTCHTNLRGILYNALPQYEAASWSQVPSVSKKRRTEKTHNAITSSTSCLNSVNCAPRLDTMGPQSKYGEDPAAAIGHRLFPADADRIASALGATGGPQFNIEAYGSILAQTERSTIQRLGNPTWTRDLAPMIKIKSGTIHPNDIARQSPVQYDVYQLEDSYRPDASINALVAELHANLTTKKRTKKRVLTNTSFSNAKVDESHGNIIIYNQNQFSVNSSGAPQLTQEQIFSAEAVVNHLQHPDINREDSSFAYKEQYTLVPYGIGNEQQNALVVYGSDGTIIPFADPLIKKRRPRAKVDLDEETNKVWQLLLENINNQGIDGTDEEKAKWWEEERNVFRGRIDSFIARMHLVQGDRRFSQWKGSVVDSVVGVFLTQNVSDYHSSSAYMSLAARFPLKFQSNNTPCYEERTGSVIDRPIVCMPDLEGSIKWNEMSNQSICDQTSMTSHDSDLDEEREAVNSNESSTSSSGIVSSSRFETYYESMESRSSTEINKIRDNCDAIGKLKATYDVMSSQDSVISFQNSEDSLIDQTIERKEAFPDNNTEALGVIKRSSGLNNFSFIELLRKVGTSSRRDVHSNANGIILSGQNVKNELINPQTLEDGRRIQNIDHVEHPKSSSEVPNAPSNNCQSFLSSNSGKMVTEETRSSNKTSSKNAVKEPSSFAEESASQMTDENDLTMMTQASRSTANNITCNKIQEEKNISIETQGKDLKVVIVSQPQTQHNEMHQELCLPNPSEEILDTMESSSARSRPEKNSPKSTGSDIIEHGLSEVKELDEMTTVTRKAKSRRVGKEIRDGVDWAALRKEAEANGKKRERTANTMDSVDWEAVRCADVSEIADAIKERGMNNVLAERIQSFLNRLVKEHGSINLEWLRDVEPDKAKEYLLSIRGLGLKSVECVRLLTLHHLAFPVDTNVGRIAVRLGWVPLQPLPESLQLHLLELYPVLESIQKYLWPRLCKLDQRTLYELHYQMITFGKVFCTKSKPNCNACPMRAECRHFASAFASARLALPGPEEKGITTTTENTNEPNLAMMVGQPLLPQPQATNQAEENQQSEPFQLTVARNGINKCQPIVEEPLSPEPERIQVSDKDMEDTFYEDPDEIPIIKLNIEEFTQNLQNYMQTNMELQEADLSKALIALTEEAAAIPTPKLKNVSRLRTEHQVYELPDSHPLLQGLDIREPDDPCSYLLAIWTPGETANSIQPPESSCNSQEYGRLCDEKTCFSCNSIREANSQIVRGTILIPCRTAMRGSFPLNGTYFQVNEVFADHDSSLNPIDVPRSWIWNLPRRTVYFGTSVPTIFKGLTTEGIQHCFWRGFVCVRGFDQKTRAPRPLMARLHFPASKLNKQKRKDTQE